MYKDLFKNKNFALLTIGGLSVPLIIKALARRNHAVIFTISSIVIAIGYTLFGYSHNFIVTFIILIVLGATQNIQGTYSSTIIQNNIPKNYIGRVFSFYKILVTLFAILGLLIASPLYDIIGIGNSFLSISLVMIILGVFQLRYWLDKKHNNSIAEQSI